MVSLVRHQADSMKVVLLLCAVLWGAQADRPKPYVQHKLIEALPRNKEQVQFFRDLLENDVEVDFWAEPRAVGRPVTFRVPPLHFVHLRVAMLGEGIPWKIVEEDLQRRVDQGFVEIEERRAQDPRGALFHDYNNFNTLDQINTELSALAGRCPAGFSCSVYSAGNSYEERPLNILRISQGSGRKAYWFDSQIHAREWIAVATIMNVAKHLIDDYSTDAEVRRILDKYDFYFMPVLNPDGYEYTWTDDRYWRKNRQPNSCLTSVGADLNRNFNFRWCMEGASTNPCSETYCGSSGASEIETQRVQAEAARIGSSLLAWTTVHSYGYMWMFPWGNTVSHAGFTCDRASDHNDMMVVAEAVTDAIYATSGTVWSPGNSCEVIYQTTGGTDDYVKGVNGVKYAFCPELRGSDFVISPGNIRPSFQEFWNGVVAMVDTING